jgi:putative transposase
LSVFADKWKKAILKVIEMLQNNAYLLTFYDYPEDIRRSIYSTNLIEGFNKQVKRKTKAKIQFPSVDSAEKYLVSLFEEYNYKQGAKMHKGFGSSLYRLLEMLLEKYKD